MGPYSAELQAQRRARLKLLLADPKLNKEMRNIWKRILNNLAQDEDEYNARVKEVYKNLHPWNHPV